MGRGGTSTDVKDLRRCLIEGNGQDRHGLIRFTLDPEQNITPDIFEELGGRGVWLTATATHLKKACERNLFAKALKQPVKIPENLNAMIEALLAKRLTSLISIARKSGQAVAGREKVHDCLLSREGIILLQARDGSLREKKNIGPREGIRDQFEVLDSHELGMAFGRDIVIHTAIFGNGITQRIEYEAHRLSGFRMLDALKSE